MHSGSLAVTFVLLPGHFETSLKTRSIMSYRAGTPARQFSSNDAGRVKFIDSMGRASLGHPQPREKNIIRL